MHIAYFRVQHHAKAHDAGADHDLSMAELRRRGFANQLIYGSKIKIYNTKKKLQAADLTLAESNLAKDSGSKVTAKCYCPDPGRN